MSPCLNAFVYKLHLKKKLMSRREEESSSSSRRLSHRRNAEGHVEYPSRSQQSTSRRTLPSWQGSMRPTTITTTSRPSITSIPPRNLQQRRGADAFMNTTPPVASRSSRPGPPVQPRPQRRIFEPPAESHSRSSSRQQSRPSSRPSSQQSSSRDYDRECVVCFTTNPTLAFMITECCGKNIHVACMNNWLVDHDTCPNCRQIPTQPPTHSPRPPSRRASAGYNCVICMDDNPELELMTTECCRNTFHVLCLNNWRTSYPIDTTIDTNTCPICRRPFTTEVDPHQIDIRSLNIDEIEFTPMDATPDVVRLNRLSGMTIVPLDNLMPLESPGRFPVRSLSAIQTRHSYLKQLLRELRRRLGVTQATMRGAELMMSVISEHNFPLNYFREQMSALPDDFLTEYIRVIETELAIANHRTVFLPRNQIELTMLNELAF